MSDIGDIWLAFVILLLIAQACAFGFAGGKMMEPFDRFGEGFALGFLLGPVGLVIAWTLRANELLEQKRRDRRQAMAPPSSATARPPATPPAPRRPSEPRRFK